MYFAYNTLFLLFGLLLVYPERSFVNVLLSVAVFPFWYYFFHRSLHIFEYNLHKIFHHDHFFPISRNEELIIDFVFEVLVVIGIPYLIQEYLGFHYIPISILMLGSLAYGLNHILNYSFLPSQKHRNHHIMENVNFYPDFMDHLFGTNSDPEYEDMIQHIPYLVQACIITHFLKAYFQWKD
jgi:hypothetical protein